jgi:hypothetical protein
VRVALLSDARRRNPTTTRTLVTVPFAEPSGKASGVEANITTTTTTSRSTIIGTTTTVVRR